MRPVPRSTASEVAGPASEDEVVFQDCFPNTKFVFPTAPLRRALAFNRSLTHQWFDNWSHRHPELKQHLQVLGLCQTSIYLHQLIQQEIDIIGAPNVVLAGLSQGCASSLVATLLWENEPFAAVVGMCGYLPFRQNMVDIVMDEAEDDEDNPFAETKSDADRAAERVAEESEGCMKFEKAVTWLRAELEMDKENRHTRPPSIHSIPVFMGHGTEDTLVPFEQGKQAADFLRAIDVDVEWNEYAGLGHWYSNNMLRDIVDFLKKQKGWESIILTKFCDLDGRKGQHERQ
jgi:predicted esterase